jgi:beta-phosphoglucomutase-like phosphatase (HAD superfamily)
MQGVIFDFNGTLFDDHAKHKEAWSQVSMELRGVPVSLEELKSLSGLCNEQIIRKFCPDMAEDDVLAASQRKEAIYRDLCISHPESFHLIEGAPAYFDKLKAAGIPFTIASASIRENIDFFVDSFHLDKWMDPASIVYDDGSYPGKKEMFEEAARRLGLPLSSITIFEDSTTGIAAAFEAGCLDVHIIDTAGAAKKIRDSRIHGISSNFTRL